MTDFTLDRLITREQLQAQLGVEKRCIQYWQSAHGLPAIRIGKKVFFDRAAVADWMISQNKNAAA